MVTGRASSMALVRYRTNDYSVPTAYAHQEVVIKGYVDRVSIICGGEQIAVHPRSYEREDFIANPLHYLALLSKTACPRSGGATRWLGAGRTDASHSPVDGGPQWQGRTARVHPGAAAMNALSNPWWNGRWPAGDGGDQL
jgi:hypothetical protein